MAAEPKVARIATDAAASAAAPAKKVIEESTLQAKKIMEETAAQARAAMEKSVAQATKATENLFKAAEEAVEFNKGTVETVSKVTQIYVAGVQDLGKQTFSLFQGYADQAVENAKALSSVKSVKEAADLQVSFSKTAFEKSMADAVKLQEASFKLAEQLAAPFAARMTAAFEKFTKPLSA